MSTEKLALVEALEAEWKGLRSDIEQRLREEGADERPEVRYMADPSPQRDSIHQDRIPRAHAPGPV